MIQLMGWAPVAVLALGGLFTLGGVTAQQTVPLRAPLASVVPARTTGEYVAREVAISEEEQRVAGMSNYLMRIYGPADAPRSVAYSLYVGYYDNQTSGRTIHSPKNCLPGAGWEALTSSTAAVATALGTLTVNRYLLQNDGQRALVLYWYQGRGRVVANEYAVKWNLLVDSALRGRSEEALVRIIVPVTGSEEDAFRLATEVAQRTVTQVQAALPV